MGQNIAGWIKITMKQLKGFEVIIEHGEILQDDNFYNKNIQPALQQFRYISNGKETIVHHFIYYGFRYAHLAQWKGQPKINDFTGCVVYSDLEMAGNFETGHSLVNKFLLNSLWSQKDNFLDVLTDCPQLDEHLGWTGDAQTFCKTAMFHMNCYTSYRKFLKDLYHHQLRDDEIPPFFCHLIMERYEILIFSAVGMIGWNDASIMLWNINLMNGKKQILQDQYDEMKM